jgi:hypothetical protein
MELGRAVEFDRLDRIPWEGSGIGCITLKYFVRVRRRAVGIGRAASSRATPFPDVGSTDPLPSIQPALDPLQTLLVFGRFIACLSDTGRNSLV